jgi:predicted acetyltransferase
VTATLDIAPPADEADLARFAAIVSRSLGPAPDRAMSFVQSIGAAHLRLARVGAQVVGGLGLLPMGHWFGGRPVSCVGVTGVAVAPEHRSRGIAAELMRAALEESRREGVALSSLYPATSPVYRAAGYETAGSWTVYRLTIADVGPGARDRELRAAGAEDTATIRAMYDARARFLAGAVERTPYFWRRVLEPIGDDARAYLVEGAGGAEGYAVLSHRDTASAPRQPMEIVVRDFVARTPAAGRRILRLLADHRSMARRATLVTGPGDPLLLAAREEKLEVAEHLRWKLRVVDVRAALERRGWSPCVRGEVHLDVRDALLPENARRWAVEVAGGRAEVREGGSGAIAIDVRGLASLFSGFLPAEELRAAGLCDGRDADLATATAVFAGPAPWVGDFY